ncbi:MAG: shikimate dehydrogenase [Nocardioidaceae bacterium]
MIRCAVLGSPIAHSLSPVMHRAAYAALGLDGWAYDAHEVDEAGLGAFLDGLDDSWRGLSLTMPLKRAAVPLVDDLTPHALSVRTVNTIVFADGRRRGDNTDIPGMSVALAERGVHDVSTAVIVGAGATAASTAASLRLGGLQEATVLVREPGRASGLARLMRGWGIDVTVAALGAEIPEVELLVSTVPADAVAGHAAGWCERAAAVFDVVYDPWPTPLAARAVRAGLPVVSGIDLLANQAALQVAQMTGEAIDAEPLRAAAFAALAAS